MCYSACKATMVAILGADPFNMTFEKTCEVREASDLDEVLSEAGAASSRALAHAAVSSRPARPKGQRRRKKKRAKAIFGSVPSS